ncbi:BZ3500_MvSof-1268-A1-R1_Chr3-1g06130 [Microbotryum saponariae]|uniref:BZ3500_MvSof-1268-A1-R1_Chr3-1g06130 protein n=1 Tax=Microbotryum saponariae TaxID=289078 RepID=A0A2X0KZD6_9BASI|nr:BZ3500_MvSof-1268-A1-R1_Chr3-1g06130 [Microbotryum saponariae]SDA03993.1 BZ3501_MvSof-1269-A2-R1_Chr3-2g05815 [Microbotryum saponariae]
MLLSRSLRRTPFYHSPTAIIMTTRQRSSSPATTTTTTTTTTTPPDVAESTSQANVRAASARQQQHHHDEHGRAAKRIRLDHHQPPVRTLPYHKGLHLAPMVRIGTLPTRLLGPCAALLCRALTTADGARIPTALDYGAELVWGPEIVDKAIIGSERVVDPKSGTIKFIKNNRSVFECHPVERPRLIFQLGSSDPELAAQAAQMIAGDVDGIGLNCGCPKHFSLQAGMGAALLSDPDKLCLILEALVKEIPLPIDVKIRLFPTSEPTLALVKRLLNTGVKCLTVHCRTKEMRSTEPALLERLREIVELGREKGVPVVENGDCYDAKDAERITEQTGVTSCMIARGAEANPSCFRNEGLLDSVNEVIPRLLRLSLASDLNFQNTRYIINSMTLTSETLSKREKGAIKLASNKAKSYYEMAEAFGIDKEAVDEARGMGIERLVPGWMERRKRILEEELGEEAHLK